jgi:Sigma-70 region 2
LQLFPVTVGVLVVSEHPDGDRRRPRREETPVGEYLQIFRARVPQQSVAALLEIRPAAIAEAQRLCPELLRAQLVRLDDGTWLDVLTRSLGHLDAQDACQEIQVRIVTPLGSFEGRSRFTTWAYTVAVRSLLRTRKRLVEASV